MAVLAAIATLAACESGSFLPQRAGMAPFSATVLDGATQRPVPGAVVTVVLPVEAVAQRSLEGVAYAHVGDLAVLETRTDELGRFEIPAVPEKLLAPGQHLADGAPLIGIFKPGYRFRRLSNAPEDGADEAKDAGVRHSRHDRTIIALAPQPAGMLLSLEELNGIINFRDPWSLRGDDRCRWTRTPALTAALLDLGDSEGIADNVRRRLPTVDRLHTQGVCPDPALLLAEWRDPEKASGPLFAWSEDLTLLVGRRTPDMEFVSVPDAPAAGIATITPSAAIASAGTVVIAENPSTRETVEARVDDEGSFSLQIPVEEGDRLRFAMIDFAAMMSPAPQPELIAVPVTPPETAE